MHSGVLPNIPVVDNDPVTLMWIRSITTDGKASKEHCEKVCAKISTNALTQCTNFSIVMS